MTTSKIEILEWVSKIFLYLALGILFYQMGYMGGYSNRGEDQKKWDCTGKYQSKTLSEVPVECLKYFEVEVKK